MSLLLSGIVIFSAAHLFPAILPRARDQLAAKAGDNSYRGLFSLVIIGALVLIVLGWKAATPTALYAPPLTAGPVSSLLVFLGFVLFVASLPPGNIKRIVRHPQMIGTIFWGAAHLLTNGDSRSVALFGGLTVWALLEIATINRRDGEWQKPAPASITVDMVTVVIGALAFAVIVYFHARFFGVSAIPT